VLIKAVEQMHVPAAVLEGRWLLEGSWVAALSWSVGGSVVLLRHTPRPRLVAASVPLTIDGSLRSSAAVLAAHLYP